MGGLDGCGWAVESLLCRCCGGAVCWRPAISLPQSVVVGEVGLRDDDDVFYLFLQKHKIGAKGVRWLAGGDVGVLRTGPVAADVRVYSSVSHL